VRLLGSLPAADSEHAHRFLVEYARLADMPVCRRPDTEALYDLPFILHPTSPAECEVLRVIALPARARPPMHFRVLVVLGTKRLATSMHLRTLFVETVGAPLGAARQTAALYIRCDWADGDRVRRGTPRVTYRGVVFQHPGERLAHGGHVVGVRQVGAPTR
jgi:hypothetical protein